MIYLICALHNQNVNIHLHAQPRLIRGGNQRNQTELGTAEENKECSSYLFEPFHSYEKWEGYDN
jgi:hypothetical protein